MVVGKLKSFYTLIFYSLYYVDGKGFDDETVENKSRQLLDAYRFTSNYIDSIPLVANLFAIWFPLFLLGLGYWLLFDLNLIDGLFKLPLDYKVFLQLGFVCVAYILGGCLAREMLFIDVKEVIESHKGVGFAFVKHRTRQGFLVFFGVLVVIFAPILLSYWSVFQTGLSSLSLTGG